MVCKELSNLVYKQYLTSVKLLQIVNTESNLPCKIHSISCHQLIRIKQLFRLHLEQDQILQDKLEQNRTYKFNKKPTQCYLSFCKIFMILSANNLF